MQKKNQLLKLVILVTALHIGYLQKIPLLNLDSLGHNDCIVNKEQHKICGRRKKRCIFVITNCYN